MIKIEFTVEIQGICIPEDLKVSTLYMMTSITQCNIIQAKTRIALRDHTSITLSVLEPSQTPTPLCYQGVIFGHTPPSPRLDYVILG